MKGLTSASASIWPPMRSQSAIMCLTGGELAALVVVDAVIRLKPGVLGDPTGALR